MTFYVVKHITKITLTATLLLIIMAACNRASTQSPMYGVKVQYAQGQTLNFPDVALVFVGKRESPATSDYPRSMTFYDFKVYRGNQAQLISWSAGTGDIGPTLFELAGNRYALELAMSDELGSLDKDELVLWQEAISATKAPIATPIPTSSGPALEAQGHFDRGLAQFAAGLPEEAVANFTQAITLDPTYVEAYQFRGDAYVQLGRYDLARADYQQVLALNPQPEIQAAVTAALQEIAQKQTIVPTSAPTALPTPTSLPAVEIALDQPFSLALNQHGRLDAVGLGVQFYQMVEDTRCPRQVECEIEGWARISIFVWITDIEPVEFILNTSLAANQNAVFYDEYQVWLLSLDPYPETAVSDIALEDYRATFIVTKPDPTPTSNLDPDMEEIAVYNALLASQFPGDNIDQVLIIDHTRVNQTSLLEMDLTRFQESASPAPELISSFKERNQQPYPLKPVLDFGLEYQLLTQEEVDNLRPLDEVSGWKLFYEKYPNSVGFIYLSRIGFSADFSQALVYMSQYHYDQPIRGGYYLMTRQDGGWVIETGMEWMT